MPFFLRLRFVKAVDNIPIINKNLRRVIWQVD
jgi:hypothetical protein